MSGVRSRFLWILLLLVFAIGALPIVTASPSLREDLFLILMLVILASSTNIIMGYTGYVSFGHIVFFGIGGYVAFFLILNYHLNFLLAALAGGVASSAVALLIGVPVLRLRGAYFALATIGINEAVRSFVENFEPFGGSVGMTFNYDLYNAYGGAGNALWYAFEAILAVALLTIAASYIVKHSKFGLGLMAIREDQDAAEVLGIDPARYKVLAYTISAFFPALAGALFFFKNGIIEPAPAFDLLRSIEALVMVMLGGFGTVIGPILGAVIYERMSAFLITTSAFSSLHLAIAGLLLLVIVLFVTNGLVGFIRERVPPLRGALQ